MNLTCCSLSASIGQWQKLVVSWAFYAVSEFLILDEPTASLDPIADQEIIKHFDTLRSLITTLFISHCLSSAIIADQIIVLENSCLIEKASQLSLMELLRAVLDSGKAVHRAG